MCAVSPHKNSGPERSGLSWYGDWRSPRPILTSQAPEATLAERSVAGPAAGGRHNAPHPPTDTGAGCPFATTRGLKVTQKVANQTKYIDRDNVSNTLPLKGN